MKTYDIIIISLAIGLMQANPSLSHGMQDGSLAGSSLLPRYQFTPGQQLTYQGHGEFKYQNGSFINQQNATLWVVRQNGDRSWHLLAKLEESSQRIDPRFHSPDQKGVAWIQADVYPDGRTDHLDSTAGQIASFPEIIPLPLSIEEMKGGWKRTGDEMQGEDSFGIVTDKSSTGAQMMIHQVHTTKKDAIYLSSDSTDITFDLKRGLPVQEDETGAQGYGFVGKSVRHTELKSVASLDPEKLSRMSDELSIYLNARKEAQALFSESGMTIQQIDDAAAKYKEILQKARGELTTPEFQKEIDEEITDTPEMLSYEKNSAQQRDRVLHTPPADWKTTDIEGKSHALTDYKGKVVVLDFWYRGCGWCMLAMPQVKEVAEHFANRPVVVLGMTTNTPESKDATFVVQKMQLMYPTLYAKEIAAGYHIQVFPTLLILDQNGVVKDIHCGYSPDLRDEVEKQVEALLKAGMPTPRHSPAPRITRGSPSGESKSWERPR